MHGKEQNLLADVSRILLKSILKVFIYYEQKLSLLDVSWTRNWFKKGKNGMFCDVYSRTKSLNFTETIWTKTCFISTIMEIFRIVYRTYSVDRTLRQCNNSSKSVVQSVQTRCREKTAIISIRLLILLLPLSDLSIYTVIYLLFQSDKERIHC